MIYSFHIELNNTEAEVKSTQSTFGALLTRYVGYG